MWFSFSIPPPPPPNPPFFECLLIIYLSLHASRYITVFVFTAFFGENQANYPYIYAVWRSYCLNSYRTRTRITTVQLWQHVHTLVNIRLSNIHLINMYCYKVRIGVDNDQISYHMVYSIRLPSYWGVALVCNQYIYMRPSILIIRQLKKSQLASE